MALETPFWNEPLGAVSGSTSFGFYDNETSFQADGIKVAKWCARQLGYPTVDLEINSGSVYDAFESSISRYSSFVNQFRIKENLLNLQGAPTSSDFTGQLINNNFSQIIRISKEYGVESGTGGTLDYKTGSISVVTDQQVYDLNELWRDVYEQGNTIEIRRVFHNQSPASLRFYDPYAGTGLGMWTTLQEFGFSNMGHATTFMMMPMSADILRVQAIEFNDMIRRSAYGFELINNKLRLFPRPTKDFTLWFQYIISEDRNDPTRGMPTGVVSDMSNATFSNMLYANINEPGRNWIRRYTLAMSKLALGHVRRKYQTIPIPGEEVSLDGGDLISDGQGEIEKLEEELKETLEATGKQAQLESKKEETESLSEILSKMPIPRPITIA